MKKALAVLAAVLLAFSFTGCSKKSAKSGLTLTDGVLKVGMEIGYPPFEYFDEDGVTPIGFDVELGKAIASKMGLKAEFVDTAWDGIFAGVDTSKYDVIMSAVTITDERKANYNFSNPYIGNGQAIILSKDSTLAVKSPADLAGLRVGYQAETTSDIFMTKQADAGLQFTAEEYDKVMNAYDDVKLGRCDAAVSDSLVAVSYLGKENSPYKQVWAGTPDEYFGICMKKGNDELTVAVNKALEEIKADGTLKAIYLKIFGVDMSDSIK
ncbi:MAG: ABC transporter substrate-binding protein [Treponema sp.]